MHTYTDTVEESCQVNFSKEMCSSKSQQVLRKHFEANKSVQVEPSKKHKSIQYLRSTVCNKLVDTSDLDLDVTSSAINHIKTYLHQELLTPDESNGDLLQQLHSVLSDAGQVDNFVKLIKSLASGKLLASNIAWKCLLDRAKWSMLRTTCSMRYDKDVLEFFSIIYILFGNAALTLLRGTGHFGHLLEGLSALGKYDPTKCDCNFAVPSVKTLIGQDFGYPKVNPVGLIEHSLDLAAEKSKSGTQYVLSFDGKLVSQGCKGEDEGDIDLWGIEGPPTLEDSKDLLKQHLQELEDLPKCVDSSDDYLATEKLKYLITCVSRRILTLRKRLTSEFFVRKRIVGLAQDNPDNVRRYRRQMSSLNDSQANCDNAVQRGLELNLQIVKTICKLNGNINMVPHSRYVKMHRHPNVRLLLPPERLEDKFDLKKDNFTRYIKQGSELWHEMRLTAHITGSTMMNAIGLRTLQAQKEHHSVHIKKRPGPPPDEETQKRLDHGRNNEINALATLVGILLPALKPPCHVYTEVCKFLKFCIFP